MAFSGIFPVFIVMILFISFGKHFVYSVITDVRLVGGPTSNKGTVEIRQNNGSWETTCGEHLHIKAVITICGQLGFAGASIAIRDTPYGQSSTPNIMIICNFDDADLSECGAYYGHCPSAAGAASCHVEGYLGCFVDYKNTDRVLPGDYVLGFRLMTISKCIQFCKESTTANYTYAGVEVGDQCFCGEASANYTTQGVGLDSDCQYPCPGDRTESCGGFAYIAVFTIHVETVETTPAVVSSEKVTEVTSQPSSEMTTMLQQSCNCSCVGVGVGEGVVIILLIPTIIVLVMYIFRNRKMKTDSHGQNTHDMTLVVQASSPHDKDTGFYHDIQDIRTPVPSMSSSTPAGDVHYSSKIYD